MAQLTAADIVAANGDQGLWLVKSEPDVYAIDDLARDGSTTWEGVRNFQARNFMRDGMKLGQRVLFYHSNATPPGIVGVCEVSRLAYPDPHQFDPQSPYYDETADPSDPRWLMVEVAFVEKLPEMVTLEALKSDPALDGMLVVRKGQRLSVQPVLPAHFDRILALGGAKSRR